MTDVSCTYCGGTGLDPDTGHSDKGPMQPCEFCFGVGYVASNDPPDYELELTKDEAELLMRHCGANIAFGLQVLTVATSREAAEKTVKMIEGLKGIRKKLLAIGVPDE